MRVKREEEDGYLTWRGRGKPITPEEIKACAAAFSVGDCIGIFFKESKVLFGKVVTKTSHFLQIKEYPGKKVKQKRSLNRSILDQGWSAFFRMLSYKLERRGGRLIKVDPRNTSRTCPQCGLVSAENRKTQASFACVACGYRANADLVGAINVLRAGRARLACGMSGAVRPLSAGTQRNLLQH